MMTVAAHAPATSQWRFRTDLMIIRRSYYYQTMEFCRGEETNPKKSVFYVGTIDPTRPRRISNNLSSRGQKPFALHVHVLPRVFTSSPKPDHRSAGVSTGARLTVNHSDVENLKVRNTRPRGIYARRHGTLIIEKTTNAPTTWLGRQLVLLKQRKLFSETSRIQQKLPRIPWVQQNKAKV